MLARPPRRARVAGSRWSHRGRRHHRNGGTASQGGTIVSDQAEKYSGENVRVADHASPYPVSRLGAPISLVDTAKAIEDASASVALRTNAQLEIILERMRALQQKAREIIDQAARDVDLLHVECRFRRVPGRIYHLYEHADGQRHFSMLSPAEIGFGSSTFVGSFRYEHDQSWTRLDEIEARDRRKADIQAFAQGKLPPADLG